MEALLAKHRMHLSQDPNSLSPPFKSHSLRYFQEHNSNNTPGPGTYSIPSLDYEKTSKYHVVANKKNNIKSQFQWILSNRSRAFFSTNNNHQIGPGSYNVQDLTTSNKQPWGKCSRFKDRNFKASAPGPGSYDPKDGDTIEQRKGAEAVFKSKTPKVSLFQITEKQPQAEDRLHSPFQETNNNSKGIAQRQKQQSYYFASKVPRFLTQSCSFETGPGSYNLALSQSKKQQFPKVVRGIGRTGSSERPQKMKTEVGPGSYNMNKYEMSRQMEYKGGHFSRQTRFNFRHRRRMNSSHLPGPGHYMQRRYNFIVEERTHPNTVKPKLPKAHYFRRHTLQGDEGDSSKKQTIPKQEFYDINNFDISFKVHKQAEHHEKLKIMNIQVAPFNSKAPRFA